MMILIMKKNEKSKEIEKGHKMLVEKLKEEICTHFFSNLEHGFLELEDVREEVDSVFFK